MSPLSAREVAHEAITTYRAYFGPLLVLALVVFVPAGLIEVLGERLFEGLEDDPDTGTIVAAVLAAVGIAGTATLGEVFYAGVVAAIVGERRSGIRRQLADVARTLPYLTLLVVDVLFALAVLFGLLLLIVPGVILFTWFVLAAPVAEIERSGVLASFARSRALVRGNFFKVLAILAPVVIAGDALAELLGEGVGEVLGHGFAADWLASVLAEGVSAPFFALAAVVTTHHLISGASPRTPRP